VQLLGYFDRVVVINLPERTDRRAGVERELARLGLARHADKVRFFAAVKPTDAGDFPSRGARGCYESHLAVLRQARADGLSNILIVEDDFASSSQLERLQSRLLAQLARTPWDMVAFGHDLPPSDREPVLVPPPASYGLTHCYAVNAGSFDALIAFLEVMRTRPAGHPLGGPMHYDGALDTFRTQHAERSFLVALPSVAGQRSSRSDITPSRLDSVPLLRGAVELARAGLRLARQQLRGARKQAQTLAAGQSVHPSIFPPR
jgi:glycosyl transferase family 25